MRKLIAVILMIGLGVAFFFYTGNLTETQRYKSNIEKLLEYDLETEYPSTPKEVVNLFSQFSKLLYNEDTKDKDVALLIEKQRLLMDEVLLEVNPIDIQVQRFLYERQEKRKIIDFKIKDITPDDYFENGKGCYVRVIFYLVEGKNIYQEFILRKDEDLTWKIIGWKETQPFQIVGE